MTVQELKGSLDFKSTHPTACKTDIYYKQFPRAKAVIQSGVLVSQQKSVFFSRPDLCNNQSFQTILIFRVNTNWVFRPPPF